MNTNIKKCYFTENNIKYIGKVIMKKTKKRKFNTKLITKESKEKTPP